MIHENTDLASGSTLGELCRMGGICAVVAGVLVIADLAVFIVWPQPATVAGWLALFQSYPPVGLLDFDLLGIFAYVILVPTLLALYLVLRQKNGAWMAVATVFTFMGIAVYLASNTGFSMLYLSGQYAAAATETQRSMMLASGGALVAEFNATAFGESFAMVSGALLITSVVMLKSRVFGARAGWVGVVANALGLGGFIAYVPALFVPGMLSMFANPAFLGVWLVLLGKGLCNLARGSS